MDCKIIDKYRQLNFINAQVAYKYSNHELIILIFRFNSTNIASDKLYETSQCTYRVRIKLQIIYMRFTLRQNRIRQIKQLYNSYTIFSKSIISKLDFS